jgi:hypothetical protein
MIMAQGYLLGRALLRFGEGEEAEGIVGDLSAATFGPDGTLWVASDELSGGRVTVSALTRKESDIYGRHRLFPLDESVELMEQTGRKTEADIEGLHVAEGYLWVTGSHSSKRSRPKHQSAAKDLERLARVATERNRYLLGRLPLQDGVPVRRAADPGNPDRPPLTAARLAESEGGNILIDALQGDVHLGPFLRTLHLEDGRHGILPLASKENGFDIEGLAVLDGRLFLGLRGPVLRGWACLLEIVCVDAGEGRLGLDTIDGGERRYRKHFLDLDGLGIRELAVDGRDLLILAGPTMTLDGALRLFRLRRPAKLGDDSITSRSNAALQPLFDLPFGRGGDNAEGLAVTSWHEQRAVLVVYDGPLPARRPAPGAVYADLFRLPD